MMVLAAFAALLASPVSPPEVKRPPSPLPAIMWVNWDGGKEVVRVALLDFITEKKREVPDTLHGKLYHLGQYTSVDLHLKWHAIETMPESWTAADYEMEVPKGATGDAVLSLGDTRQGWRFRLGEN